MSTSTLHYIYDPLCGWCYAAAPLIKEARQHVAVQAHGGGMMAGARRQQVSAQLRDYVMPHDRRIAQVSGQPFGASYFDGLLRDTSVVFDSEPPTAAMLVAEQLAGRGLDMLARLQTAHYLEGRRIADRAVLIDIAAELGLPRDAFAGALGATLGEGVRAHIAATRALMGRVGAQGFPTLVLESEGRFVPIDLSSYLGRPEAFAQWLQSQIPNDHVQQEGAALQCGPDSCSMPGA
ncbi:protein-disulfide isomerase [Hylemonella gracilis str. Niagara R]|uniref:Protein-disulfide isomerase n=1 Tax=Hylemonella gracilis str. Niagara R TaxID=1458275 RepID=A0A016XIY4_9BURK|nr:DsbA family protein [Hylemonella gracilis]EYC51512.1 protein-disulfide isomerase [Hylemonella gracilis str. Niagara R]